MKNFREINYPKKESHIIKIPELLNRIFSIYLALFLTFAVSFHHLSVEKLHNHDCRICAAASQSFLPNISPIFTAVFVVFLLAVSSRVLIKSFYRENQHLRDPPIF